MARKVFTLKNLFILVLQGCFLLSGIFFMGANHGFVNAVYASEGTPGLSFSLVSGTYHVAKGTVAADITEIVIPATYEGLPVREIVSNGFANLLNLQTVVLPEGLRHLGMASFSGCASLQSITLPSTMITLGNNSFRNCTSLISMVVPSSVTTISSGAFYGCTSLQSIVLPNTITNFSNTVFSECTSLTNIMTSGTEKQTNGTHGIYVLDASGTAVTTGGIAVVATSGTGASIHTLINVSGAERSVTVPSGVTHIGDSAFSRYVSLENVSLPNTVITLARNAFFYCENLVSVVIPNSVTTMGDAVFLGCTSLTSITLPNSITSFGAALRLCPNLTNININSTAKQTDGTNGIYVLDASGSAVTTGGVAVVLVSGTSHTFVVISGSEASITVPAGVTHLGNNAFTGYVSLTSINLPNSLERIGNGTFSNAGLTSIVLPNSLTFIDSNAFVNCFFLTSITIPSSVTSVGGSAFWGCASLIRVVMQSETPVTLASSSAFTGTHEGLRIQVPVGSAAAYKAATNWSGYESFITEDTYFVVIFKNADQSMLSLQTTLNGESAIAPSNPDGFEDAQYTITFTGWDLPFANVTSDLTVTAQFNTEINQYTVTFKNWDDSTLDTQSVAYGNGAVAPTNPSKTSTVQYNYTFDGWDTAFDNITGDLTVTALYSSSIREYDVNFINWDQSVLSAQTVAYGNGAVAPTNPTRVATAQYTYIFEGWDTEFDAITGNLTVTAVYTSVVNEYTVTFKNWDDSVLSAQILAYGNGAIAPASPTRQANAQYTYIFDGWDTEFDTITGNLTVTATYTLTVNEYTVTFKNWDESVLSTQTIAYGNGAVAPANPIKAASPQLIFVFIGWDEAFSSIVGDLTVTANFTSLERSYVVTFNANGGTAVAQQDAVNGGLVIRPTDPTKTGLAFSGWYTDQSLQTAWNFETDNMPTNHITLFASWTANITVVVEAEETEILVEQGIELNSITPPTKLGHTFLHWTYNNAPVTDQTVFNYAEQVVLTASFSANTYTISFDTNGTEDTLVSKAVVYAQAVGLLPTPEREGYEFKGWTIDGQTITSETVFGFASNVTLIATWQEVPAGVSPILLGGAAAAAGILLIASAYAITSKKKLKVISSQITNQGEILKQIKQQTAPKPVSSNPSNANQVNQSASKPPLPPKPPAK